MSAQRGESGGRRRKKLPPRRGSTTRSVTSAALDLLDRLSLDQYREACRLTEEDIRMLERLSRGYVRGGKTILEAIQTRADRAYGRPAQEVQHSGGLTVQYVSAYADGDDGGHGG